MLIVVSVNQSVAKPPPTEVAPDKVVNESMIFDVALLPANVLAPPQVVNESQIHDVALMPLIVHMLSPAQVVNATTIYVQTMQKSTSYDNVGGKGNRTAIITVTSDATLGGGTLSNLVDGAFVSNLTDSVWWAAGQSGRTLTFDFGVGNAAIIQEAKHYSSTAASHGQWKWRGSQNAVDWVDLSATFTFAAGFEGFVQGNLAANNTAFRYYQLFQVSGTTASNPWQQEWEFKIAGL